MAGENTLVLQATIRSLIREELSQGLDDFKDRAQESLRQVLFTELPRAGFFTGRTSQKSFHEPPSELDMVQQVIASGRAAGAKAAPTPLRHAAANKEEPNLPGIVVEADAESPNSSRKCLVMAKTAEVPFAQFESQETWDKKRETCACGEVFKDQSRFCRKCGAMRVNLEKCFCGAMFMDGCAFCKKCGRERPSVIEDTEKNLVIHQASGIAKKKRVRPTHALFKQTTMVEKNNLQVLTTSRFYEAASVTLILTNAIYLGWETQYLAERARDHADRNEAIPNPPGALTVFQVLFCLAFTVELTLRWMADGLIPFFHTPEVTWNVLDVFIVGVSMLELFLDFVCWIAGWTMTDAFKKISVLRMLRVIRIARVARVIRVTKFFRELRMMIYSILGCVKNLVWVFIVLLMTFYIFGVGFTSAVTDYLDKADKWNDTNNKALVTYFGTVDKALMSLFMSMSGGNDWSVYYDALKLIGLPYTAAFVIFIVFTIFAVVNIVTGVFVESTLQSNTKDRELVVHEEMQEKKEYLQNMAEIFEEMDEDCKGTITMDEFDAKLSDARVVAYFSSLKLDVTDARILFELLDFDHSGEISIDEFLDGCYKLQGESRALDTKIMQYEVKFLSATFQEMRFEIEVIDKRVKSIAKALKVKNQSLDKHSDLAEEREPTREQTNVVS